MIAAVAIGLVLAGYDGYHTVTPSLIVSDAANAIEFYKRGLGAVEVSRMLTPDGRKIGHAEIKIGDSVLFLADEFPGMGAVSPQTLNGSTVSFYLYVEECDEWFDRAVAAGHWPRRRPRTRRRCGVRTAHVPRG